MRRCTATAALLLSPARQQISAGERKGVLEPRVEAGSALQRCRAKAGRVMGVTRRSECRGAGEQQPRPFRQLCQEWGAAAMCELPEGQREPTAPTQAWRRTARRGWLAWALPTIAVFWGRGSVNLSSRSHPCGYLPAGPGASALGRGGALPYLSR